MLPVLFEERALSALESDQTFHAPAFDCYETADAWEVRLDLPGVARGDLSATFEDGVLTIRGSRKGPEIADGHHAHCHRWAGAFVRTFKLGRGVDADGLRAALKDGVLEITVPKAEAAKPRQITIQS